MFGFNNEHFRVERSSTYTRPKNRAGNQTRTPLLPLAVLQELPRPMHGRRRARQPEFEIFVDVDIANAENGPPKRPRTDSRAPLSVRTDSGNSTPVPSPRLAITPSPFWLTIETRDENDDPSPPITPPTTPAGPSSGPTPNAGPPPPPRRSARITRGRRVVTHRPLPPPVNTMLYELLELQDWSVGVEQIMAAYRGVALREHPDRVAEAEREAATTKMQKVNGAKEVLSDGGRRRKYHADGVLPWAV